MAYTACGAPPALTVLALLTLITGDVHFARTGQAYAETGRSLRAGGEPTQIAMAAIEPATDATAPPSTHDANTDDGAASERPDGQHDRPLGGRPHAAPMAMSPGGAAPHAPGLQHGCSLPPAASFPTSLRAGGRLYDPQSKRGMEAAPSMRTSVPLKRDLAYDIKIAKHAALLQAASLAAARIKSTGDLTPSSPGTGEPRV
ncbi:hypothetical protein T492DRAFT_864254 [Pavlovales sp. CCMP2436]|nr:hypothetical protein T492DRAFT_864254 [Pavlovales sp. CCMP2436]